MNGIETVDWYNRQYERYEEVKAVRLPACYIEVPELRWETLGEGVQAARAEISLHLVAFDVADSPVPALQLARELHQAIQGHRLMDGSRQLAAELVRSFSRMEQYDQLKVVVQGYATTLYDYSTLVEYGGASPSLVLLRPQ